jgi:hypothetical protein
MELEAMFMRILDNSQPSDKKTVSFEEIHNRSKTHKHRLNKIPVIENGER